MIDSSYSLEYFSASDNPWKLDAWRNFGRSRGEIPPPMQSNFSVDKTGKAVVVANYHSPDFTYEKISTETVKRGAIVEVCQERFSPFAIRVWLNVNPIFGRILWQRICVSEHFCVNLTTWLFHQWRGIKESNGKGATRSF